MGFHPVWQRSYTDFQNISLRLYAVNFLFPENDICLHVRALDYTNVVVSERDEIP